MSSLITNFVSLSDQDRDLLTPVEFRTIVEMIRSILNSYEFKKLDGVIKSFYIHLNTKDPLYKDSGIDFYTKIIESTYTLYANMVPMPLSLDDFKTQIVPTLGFVELFRRIVLNRFLYDQLKAPNGSIPAGTYSVYLSPEWRLTESYPNPISVTFNTTLATEIDFIRLGWNGNTTPLPTIFTADVLTPSRIDLPIIFSTTSDSISSFDSVTPFILPSVSNDLTFHINYSNTPSAPVNLLKLNNTVDMVSVDLATDKTVSVSLNSKQVLKTAISSTDGKVVLIVDKQGYLSIQITDQIGQLRDRAHVVFRDDRPMTILTTGAPFRNPFTNDFGLRSFTVYQGFEEFLEPDPIVVPLGYELLIDASGRYLCDKDGTPLMDVTIDTGADERGNFVYLTDNDGSYLMDENGNYYIVPADDYYAIVDDDNANLVDDDSSPIIESYP